jgi:hypothetical protein
MVAAPAIMTDRQRKILCSESSRKWERRASNGRVRKRFGYYLR